MRQTPYPRLRRQRSVGLSVRRDVISGLLGSAIGIFAPDEAADPAIRFAYGAVGAVATIVLIEIIWFVCKYIWVTPREMHAEDQDRIVAMEKELKAAKEPTGLQVHLREDPGWHGGLCSVTLHNHGVADQFAVTAGYSLPGGYANSPSTFRWKGSPDKRMHIVGGRYATFEMFRVDYSSDTSKPQYEQTTIHGVKLLTADGEADVPVTWLKRGQIIEPLYMSCHIVASLSGLSADFHVILNVATNGHREPQISLVVVKE